ncbi:MAG: type VI secretion system ATPase TssH, partial [Proteobacteria bacterium]|nr:type VI secretion system ATPase TssH [Pseudomonadota bacterium]
MTDISLEAVTGKLNRAGYDAFIQALRHAKSAGNRNIELAHWLFHILQQERTDLSLTVDHYKVDRARLLSDLAGVIAGFRKNETDMPGVANNVVDVLDRGWHYATLFFGETQIRTGHVLVAALKSTDLRRAFVNLSKEFDKINVEALTTEHRNTWAGSEEENLRPMDGAGLRGADSAGSEQAQGPKGTTPLDRFSQDLTAKAKSGEMDPILGR